jgi:hypothetical protein
VFGKPVSFDRRLWLLWRGLWLGCGWRVVVVVDGVAGCKGWVVVGWRGSVEVGDIGSSVVAHGRQEKQERDTTKVVSRLTHLAIPASLRRVETNRPTSLRRGEGRGVAGFRLLVTGWCGGGGGGGVE